MTLCWERITFNHFHHVRFLSHPDDSRLGFSLWAVLTKNLFPFHSVPEDRDFWGLKIRNRLIFQGTYAWQRWDSIFCFLCVCHRYCLASHLPLPGQILLLGNVALYVGLTFLDFCLLPDPDPGIHYYLVSSQMLLQRFKKYVLTRFLLVIADKSIFRLPSSTFLK